jgi:hypothetical protein
VGQEKGYGRRAVQENSGAGGFSACSEEAFHIAVSLARLLKAETLLLHVIDTKSLETLNRLGLASITEEKVQKKRLGHHAITMKGGLLLLNLEAV